MIVTSLINIKMILSIPSSRGIEFMIEDIRYGLTEGLYCIQFSIRAIDENEESLVIYKEIFKGNDRDRCIGEAFESFIKQWDAHKNEQKI